MSGERVLIWLIFSGAAGSFFVGLWLLVLRLRDERPRGRRRARDDR
jgi:hypothetical protein